MNTQNQLTTTDGPAGSLAPDPRSAPSLAELERLRLDITHQHIWNNAMTRGNRPRPPDTSALDAKIHAAKEAAGKLFWQRTQSQVATSMGMPAERHRRYVEDALKAGKVVPAHVLKDYPDLLPNKH